MKILRYRSLEEIPNYHKKSVPTDTINFLIFTLISKKKRKGKFVFTLNDDSLEKSDRRIDEGEKHYPLEVARISRGKYASQACKVNC